MFNSNVGFLSIDTPIGSVEHGIFRIGLIVNITVVSFLSSKSNLGVFSSIQLQVEMELTHAHVAMRIPFGIQVGSSAHLAALPCLLDSTIAGDDPHGSEEILVQILTITLLLYDAKMTEECNN